MMKYSDGSEARVGDQVALHFRTYTGTVQHIIDTPTEVRAWGLDERGPKIDTSYGGMVYHSESDLSGEEIELEARSSRPEKTDQTTNSPQSIVVRQSPKDGSGPGFGGAPGSIAASLFVLLLWVSSPARRFGSRSADALLLHWDC